MANLLKIAGMIDPHVHLRDLEWSHKATFASETVAALAGGYWAVFDMPNTAPSTIDRPALDRKLASISAQAVCDWGVYFGASQAGNWAEYPYIADEVCGLKIYCNATTGNLLVGEQALRAEHYQHWTNQRVIAVHAEEETVLDVLELVRQTRKWTHFCHISTAQEIHFLTAAKEEGLPISIGVCPHHLYLSQDDLPTLGAYGLMKPELKTKADCAALWDAIARGIVDVIESDHAPHTIAEKESERPPFGVPGLETTLPLMALAVKEGRITEEMLVKLLATNAQHIFNLHPDPQTYTLVDMEQPFTLTNESMRTACGWTPFAGMDVVGKVREVWIRGVKVFANDEILVSQGFGTNLFANPQSL